MHSKQKMCNVTAICRLMSIASQCQVLLLCNVTALCGLMPIASQCLQCHSPLWTYAYCLSMPAMSQPFVDLCLLPLNEVPLQLPGGPLLRAGWDRRCPGQHQHREGGELHRGQEDQPADHRDLPQGGVLPKCWCPRGDLPGREFPQFYALGLL